MAPAAVIEALAEVRESGICNMIDIRQVVKEVQRLADQPGKGHYHLAVVWLVDNRSQYMEALIQMGASVKED